MFWLTKQKAEELANTNTRLVERNQELDRYQGILDVDREIDNRRREIAKTEAEAAPRAMSAAQSVENQSLSA